MLIEHSNEIDLIQQTIAGNTSAFDRLVKTHRTTVYALVLSYTKNPADAEDLTQRIFIRAYEQLATLREWDRFLPWLQRITHNTCKDWLRRQSDSTTNFEAVNDADFAETASSPEEIALKREVEAVVREAIGALQETDRKLVEGRYIDGASYDQLQVESGLSYAAIANRLKRAKQQLRRRIEKLLGGMAILPGRTLISGGIETVKLSAKTKLAMVGVVAVLGIGGGVWYHHTFESNPVVDLQDSKDDLPISLKAASEKAASKSKTKEGEDNDGPLAEQMTKTQQAGNTALEQSSLTSDQNDEILNSSPDEEEEEFMEIVKDEWKGLEKQLHDAITEASEIHEALIDIDTQEYEAITAYFSSIPESERQQNREKHAQELQKISLSFHEARMKLLNRGVQIDAMLYDSEIRDLFGDWPREGGKVLREYLDDPRPRPRQLGD